MSLRGILTIAAFLIVFLGLMSMVGQVHVGEFFGSLALGAFAAVIVFLKMPKPKSKQKITSE